MIYQSNLISTYNSALEFEKKPRIKVLKLSTARKYTHKNVNGKKNQSWKLNKEKLNPLKDGREFGTRKG